MKKFLAVLMAVLMAFSFVTFACAAEADPTEENTTQEEMITYPESDGIPNIINNEGLVFPENFNQLKMSFVFKIVERIINFFLGLFGGDTDANLTDSVSDLGKWLDEIISNISGSLN